MLLGLALALNNMNGAKHGIKRYLCSFLVDMTAHYPSFEKISQP
jgi:hypothetical protein